MGLQWISLAAPAGTSRAVATHGVPSPASAAARGPGSECQGTRLLEANVWRLPWFVVERATHYESPASSICSRQVMPHSLCSLAFGIVPSRELAHPGEGFPGENSNLQGWTFKQNSGMKTRACSCIKESFGDCCLFDVFLCLLFLHVWCTVVPQSSRGGLDTLHESQSHGWDRAKWHQKGGPCCSFYGVSWVFPSVCYRGSYFKGSTLLCWGFAQKKISDTLPGYLGLGSMICLSSSHWSNILDLSLPFKLVQKFGYSEVSLLGYILQRFVSSYNF